MVVILGLEIERVQERVAGRRIDLTVAPKAREFLIKKGFDKAYGARQLRRAVERHLEDPMAEAILRGEIEAGKPVSIRAGKDKLTFVQ
jgi:ATP-dependent Clp protease ATP-binding subunit ClpA